MHGEQRLDVHIVRDVLYHTTDTMHHPPTTLPFHAVPGLHIPLPCSATPLQYVELFFTLSVWRYIMNTTNEYARISLGRMPPRRRSLFRRWRDITLLEIKAFVGLIVNMGLVQLSDIKDYWSTHVTLHLPFFRTVFARDRFLQIYWMLHVGEIPSTTRRSKIQPFLDLLLPLFHSYLTPFREVSADEAMIAFRGRVAFRQYVKGKPQLWGIKAYVLSESRSGYMYNLVIYYGKETLLSVIPGKNHTTNVVMTLMEPLSNMGYDLYVDRFYTSPELATELLRIGSTITGTVMSNRRNMPAKVRETRQKRGDAAAYHGSPQVVVQWTDKRTLITLSTKYTNAMVSVPSR